MAIMANFNREIYMSERADLFSKTSLVIFKIQMLELVLGGGGRLTAVGPVSLRMVLFGLAVGCTIVHVARGRRIPRSLLMLMILFSGSLVLAVAVGLFNESPAPLIWEDVKPLLFFYGLPFFYFSVTDLRVATDVGRLIRLGGMILASMFLLILVLIHTDIVPFLSFYHAVVDSEEFFFRGELSFVFKGFLYLGVAFVFVQHAGGRTWIKVLLLSAIVLTVTRGFWVSLALTYAIYYLIIAERSMFRRASLARSFAYALLSVLLIFFGRQGIAGASRLVGSMMDNGAKRELNSRLLGDRDYSDGIRISQVRSVAELTTPGTALIGHGFGQGIPDRPIHMEIAYLEIFHKQGIVGLAVWGYLFFLIWTLFRRAGDVSDALPFFLAAVFVAIQSAFNQYMNNPIGMSMIMLTLTVLLRVNEKPDVK
jgi:hypothetical protein